jgi:hypothetical protein
LEDLRSYDDVVPVGSSCILVLVPVAGVLHSVVYRSLQGPKLLFRLQHCCGRGQRCISDISLWTMLLYAIVHVPYRL